jgi:hypothetical protein
MEIILALTSPEGVVMLIIAGAGLGLGILVGLGGYGDRNFPPLARWIFGVISGFLFIVGMAGVFAIISPKIELNNDYSFQDFHRIQIQPSVLISIFVVVFISLIVVLFRKNRKFSLIKREGVLPKTNIQWNAVIVPNKYKYGRTETYAGIRIDDEEKCSVFTARLVKVICDSNPLKLDVINPTNEPLRWDKKNNCVIKLINDEDGKIKFLFTTRDYEIQSGLYDLTIEITKKGYVAEKINKTIAVKKSQSKNKIEWR